MTVISNLANERAGRLLLGAAVVFVSFFTVLFLLGLWAPDSPILTLGNEDQPLENLGAVFWAGASILCAYRLFRGQQPRFLLAMWMGLAFLFFGEEISWFQRILGFETPDAVKEVNSQGEFNLHNLRVGIGNTQNIFRMGFAAYFLVLPALTLSSRVSTWAAKVGYYRPDNAFLFMVWGVIGASVILQLAVPDEARRALVETRESFFAFSVLVYVYLYLRSEALPEERGDPANL